MQGPVPPHAVGPGPSSCPASALRLGRFAGRIPGVRRRLARMVTCAYCGADAPGEVAPLTWTSAVEQGRLRLFCDRCSRDHLRAMEGKLDSEHW